jgi:hypothetical protein
MSDVPMPRDLTEEAVARWVASTRAQGFDGPSGLLVLGSDRNIARAVLAWCEAKVREGVAHPRERVVAQSCGCCSDVVEITPDEIVARVMNKEAANG